MLLQILRKPDGGSRGFGFVTYKDEMSVEKCLVMQHSLSGKTVELKRAVKKEEMSGGGGGMGMGGGGGYGMGGGAGTFFDTQPVLVGMTDAFTTFLAALASGTASLSQFFATVNSSSLGHVSDA